MACHAALSACRANLQGLGRRQKLRLRWYDKPTPGQEAFLEIKWRNNRITGKHRFEIQSQLPLHQLTFKQIRRELFNVCPPELIPDLARYSEPIVIVQYRREHFVSTDKALRMTLDYDLTFFDQRGRERLTTRFGRKLEGFLVMEGKTPIGREAELRKLIYPFTPRAGRCSKYVHGCHALGHYRGSL